MWDVRRVVARREVHIVRPQQLELRAGVSREHRGPNGIDVGLDQAGEEELETSPRTPIALRTAASSSP